MRQGIIRNGLLQSNGMRKRTILLTAFMLLACAMLLLAGCSDNSAKSEESDSQETPYSLKVDQATGEVSFIDDLGNQVTLSDPQRVIAGMGSFANAWELAGGSLVGVSDDARESYEIASDAEDVGDFSNPNLEAILALDPDFVILTSGTGGRGGDSSQADLQDALDAADVPYAYFNVTDFNDYKDMMSVFTAITGRDDLYGENVANVDDAISGIIDGVPEGSSPEVLLAITYPGGVRVQNSSTQTGAMLADLGAVNIADENPSLLSDFSIEAVIEADPEYILLLPMGNSTEASQSALEQLITSDPAWESLSAIEDGDYRLLSPELYLYKPNNRWDEPYQELYEFLYGAE